MNMEIIPLFPQETPAPSMSSAHPPQALSAPVDSLNFAAVFAAMREALLEFGLLPAIPAAETSQTDASASTPGNAPEPDADDAAASAMTAGDAGHWAAAAAMTMGNVPMTDTPESGAWLAAVIGAATSRSPGAMDGPVKGNASLLAAPSFMGLNASSQSGGRYGSAASELNANMPGAVPLGSGALDALEIGVPPTPPPSPASVATSGASAAGVAVVLDAVPPTQAAD
ncbi:MAG TPA: hypothetical protein ENN65_07240, partial [Candidatus Hydrogenedentes bacterium]|nr:hypothetical protein [Candidatus Hydrogenedentota bacterium]